MVARSDDGPQTETGPRPQDRTPLEESLAEALPAVASADGAAATRLAPAPPAPLFPKADSIDAPSGPVPRPPGSIPSNLRLLAPAPPVTAPVMAAVPDPLPEPIRLVLPPPLAPPAIETVRISVPAWKPEDDDILPLNRSRRRFGR